MLLVDPTVLRKIHFLPTPVEWRHNPAIQNKEGMTMAMILADHNIAIPSEWEHNPIL